MPSSKPNNIDIREAQAGDRPVIMSLLERTDFFRPDELVVAAEVFDDAIAKIVGCDYQSFVAVSNGKPVGWICFGPVPCTIGTFDVYWIAVDPQHQNKGIGSQLMQYAVDAIKMYDGRLAVIETSSTERYASTQRFYEKTGFYKAAQIKDFYTPGDDKIIYIRKI